MNLRPRHVDLGVDGDGRGRERDQTGVFEQRVDGGNRIDGDVHVGAVATHGCDDRQHPLRDPGCVDVRQCLCRYAEREAQRGFQYAAQVRDEEERLPTIQLSRGLALVVAANPRISGEHPTVDAVRFDELEQRACERWYGKPTVEDLEIGIADGIGRTDSISQGR